MAKINVVKKKVLSIVSFNEIDFGYKESTHRIYIGSALSFIKNNVRMGVDIDLDHVGDINSLRKLLREYHLRIIGFLKSNVEYAKGLTSDSWRQRRIALEALFKSTELHNEAALIAEVQNPSDQAVRQKRPDARRRMSTVDAVKFKRLLDDRVALGDTDSWAILTVMDALGVRPCEVGRITIRLAKTQNGRLIVDVRTAKNTLAGELNEKATRGVDRTLEVLYSENLIAAINHCSDVSSEVDDFKGWINSSRGRVFRAAKKLFKNDKKRFCFYTLRHQMGSLVKQVFADDEDGARKVAAVLGHKCTKSSQRYGDVLTGKSLVRVKHAVKPSAMTISKVIDNRSTLIIRKSVDSARENIFVKKVGAALKGGFSEEVRKKKIKAATQKFRDTKFKPKGGHGPAGFER